MQYLIVCVLTALFLVPALGQTKEMAPAPGSAERKALLDALREPVEKDLGQEVVFKIDHIGVQEGWAFVRGVPQRPDGSEVDYTKTKYQEARDLGAFDDGFSALLRKSDGKWKVVIYSIGATDVVWEPWREEYKAPAAIFG
jgi:hypothetical protein